MLYSLTFTALPTGKKTELHPLQKKLKCLHYFDTETICRALGGQRTKGKNQDERAKVFIAIPHMPNHVQHLIKGQNTECCELIFHAGVKLYIYTSGV